jgi:hypothetical protein
MLNKPIFILAEDSPVLVIAVTAVVFLVLGVGALYFFRGYEHFARKSLDRRYAGLSFHSEPQPGDVIVTYHTYHGFLAWFTQVSHSAVLPPDDARKLLGRLLRFNLTWGLVTPGALFIPPLSVINYFVQRSSIAHQEAFGGVSMPDQRPRT